MRLIASLCPITGIGYAAGIFVLLLPVSAGGEVCEDAVERADLSDAGRRA